MAARMNVCHRSASRAGMNEMGPVVSTASLV